jgi:predicted amidohydrolase
MGRGFQGDDAKFPAGPTMSRVIKVAAAQMGATQKADQRAHTLHRMLDLLEGAAERGARLVVFPELAFTTFFPRWLIDGPALDAYFEPSMPNPAVQPLFDRARELGVGFYVGYAEIAREGRRFNSSILVQPDGSVLGRYRKVHLPGTREPRENVTFQQLEKRYFEYGDLGFPAFRAGEDWRRAIVGMMICNDRRWPEAWRVLGLQGVELVCLGYNSAAYDPNGGASEDSALRTFHSKLVVQANAYMNATWAVAVAKAGDEDGSGLIGGSCIVDPNGRIVAEASTLGDEIVAADCDLDMCRQGKDKMFNFAAHRRPQQYGAITEQIGVVEPVDQPGVAQSLL